MSRLNQSQIIQYFLPIPVIYPQPLPNLDLSYSRQQQGNNIASLRDVID